MARTKRLIASQTLGSSAASITLSSIPATFDDLLIVASLRNTAANAAFGLRFNGDSGSNYSWRILYGNGASAASSTPGSTTTILGHIQGSESTANVFGVTHIYIPNYAGSTNKSVSVESAGENNGTTAYIGANAGLWSNTAVITSVTLLSDPGGSASNLATYSSIYLFGISHS